MTSLHSGNNSSTNEIPETLASIDLGSNSFHMVVGRTVYGEIRTLDKLGEKIQLAAGLDDKNYLSEEAQERGLDCLRRFAQRLQGIPPNAIQVVGTNALRVAKNAREFTRKAEAVLGAPVEIIAGREEARLVYLGVAHTLADDAGRKLVIDIGGGSTEFIIGERFETQALESLHMGCVSFRERYFKNGEITEKGMQAAITHASRELLNIQYRFQTLGWQTSIGSSGSIKAIAQLVESLGYSKEGITAQSLNQLKAHVVSLGHIDQLHDMGVKKDRISIFPSGLAILCACFEVLAIDIMTFADGALREGLLYDMIGRIQHEDVRERTISALQERYRVDTPHAQTVERTAMYAFRQVQHYWGLNADFFADLLRWSSRLHEIGLAISHTQYHKHGAYLIKYSDLSGFSNQLQQAIASLIRSHRRKLSADIFSGYSDEQTTPLLRLSILLRLAVTLNRSRDGSQSTTFKIDANSDTLSLEFEPGWLKQHPLTRADLESEAEQLKAVGYTLSIS
ncbi:exopolyphosphatase [Alkalimarinus coralli]|uniref:exopolyphosphatase n=1 Tax=Alkalimarinus coralli TaxID=2935863 RepID=UPI00202AD652|nr:exopolyphosphatase [Alkalimarinus coralli]